MGKRYREGERERERGGGGAGEKVLGDFAVVDLQFNFLHFIR